MHTFLINVAQAAGIWLVLMVVGIVVALALAKRGVPAASHPQPRRLGGRRDRRGGAARDPGRGGEVAPAVANPGPRRPLRRLRGSTDAVNRRYAEEAANAADRAAVTARLYRQEWLTAQQRVEATRRALQVTASAGAGRTSPLTPETAQTPAEYAAREQHLHRAATAAYWRGDISASTLVDALAHRDGWNPRLHPAEQDVAISRAARADRLRAHQTAVESERAAWQKAMVAAADARILRAEALAAAPHWWRWRIRRLPAVAPLIAPPPVAVGAAPVAVDAVRTEPTATTGTQQTATRTISGARTLLSRLGVGKPIGAGPNSAAVQAPSTAGLP